MSLFNVYAPTSTSATSQTLHNTATQPDSPSPASSTDEPVGGEDIALVFSSPLSSLPSPKTAQPSQVTPKKRGRPKKILLSPQHQHSPPQKIAAVTTGRRGRGRPRKIPLSPRKSPDAMGRSGFMRQSGSRRSGSNPVAHGTASDPGPEIVYSDDDEDDDNDGERAAKLLKQAHAEVQNTTPKAAEEAEAKSKAAEEVITKAAAKSKRGQPKGGWKKNTDATPKSMATKPKREAATESAKKTSASYALTSDPVADNSSVGTPVVGDAAPKKGKRAKTVHDGDEEGDAAPQPARKRGRPRKNRVEQPVGRARAGQHDDEPMTVDADDRSDAGESDAPPKRNRGRPSKEAEAGGPSKALGGRTKKGTSPISADLESLILKGFTFGMKKVVRDGVERSVLEGQFAFLPRGDDEDTSAYQIEMMEGGGFKMTFSGELQ